jgi:integrase
VKSGPSQHDLGLKYLQNDPVGGRARWYFRRRGFPRIRLRSDFGSPEFLREYWTVMAAAKRGPLHNAPKAGSLSAICQAFLTDEDRMGHLRPNSIASYTRWCQRVCDVAGDLPAAQMTTNDVRELFKQITAAPSSTNEGIRTLKLVFDHAIARGEGQHRIQFNPVIIKELKRRPVHPGGWHRWSDAELAAYETRWPIGTRQRLPFDLMLYLGVRIGDLMRLSPKNVIQDPETGTWCMEWIQQKKANSRDGEPEVFPIHAALLESLDATIPPAHWDQPDLPFILNIKKNQPYRSPHGFAKTFGFWIRAAGLPTDAEAFKAGLSCSAHGLRKSFATMLARHKATQPELKAALTHASDDAARYYIDLAKRREFAANAIERLPDRRQLGAQYRSRFKK